MNVGFLGLGKLGLPVSLAVENKGHKVFGFDISKQTIDDIKNKKILCIGDNLNTDIKGANVQNFKSLFIMSGIHNNENNINELKIKYDVEIDYTQKNLVW